LDVSVFVPKICFLQLRVIPFYMCVCVLF